MITPTLVITVWLLVTGAGHPYRAAAVVERFATERACRAAAEVRREFSGYPAACVPVESAR